ncbi:MAG: alanine/glycine:cation symporter family protein [Alphaproteobacteria bacterium]
MLELIESGIGALNQIVWGPPMLALLLLVGIYYTYRTRVLQLRHFGGGVSRLLGLHKFKYAPKGGDVSSFGALMTTLSSTIGTGNIGGVAIGLALGGPGALFWMWITALVGMATSFAEASLAVHYREKDKDGRTVGGPMYYIKNGLGRKWVWLGIVFATFGIFAALGTGSYIQANSVAAAVKGSFDLGSMEPAQAEALGWQIPIVTGLLLAAGAAAVILGGIRWIASVASVLVPFMAIGYFGGGLIIIGMHLDQVPAVFGLIFRSAFGYEAAAGGFAGVAFWLAIKWGVARGIFSNEAGQGSSPIAHAAARVDHPVDQGLMAMIGIFIDTIVVCTITGLVILLMYWDSITGNCNAVAMLQAGGAIEGCLSDVRLTTWSFEQAFVGGETFVTVALAVFAFTTILGWSYYGERCAEFLFGEKIVVPFRVLWVLWTFFGAAILVVEDQGITNIVTLIWLFGDTLTALMAAPNLIALAMLSPIVLKLAKDFFSGKWEMADPQERDVPDPEY